jgi:hypothetical protein
MTRFAGGSPRAFSRSPPHSRARLRRQTRLRSAQPSQSLGPKHPITRGPQMRRVMCPTFSACVRRSWAEDLRTTRSHLQARALPFLSRTLGLESRRAVAPRHLQPRCKAQLLAALLIRHRAPGRDHRRKPCSRLNESSVASQHTGLYELTAVLECLPGGLVRARDTAQGDHPPRECARGQTRRHSQARPQSSQTALAIGRYTHRTDLPGLKWIRCTASIHCLAHGEPQLPRRADEQNKQNRFR